MHVCEYKSGSYLLENLHFSPTEATRRNLNVKLETWTFTVLRHRSLEARVQGALVSETATEEGSDTLHVAIEVATAKDIRLTWEENASRTYYSAFSCAVLTI